MAKVRTLQSSFNSGVIDPAAHGRVDLTQYYRGVRVGINLEPSPLGGVRRRGGTLVLGEVPKQITRLTSGIAISTPNGGTGANANDGDEATLLETTIPVGGAGTYVVVKYDLGTAQQVTFADVVGFKLSSGSTDTFQIQYSNDDVTWTTLQGPLPTITTTPSTHRRVGPVTARYWAIIGNEPGSAGTATISEFNLWVQDATYGVNRLVEFAFDVNEVYALSFTDRNIDVYRSEVYQASIRSPYTSAQLADVNWTQSADIILLFHPDVQTQELARITDTDWQFSNAPLTNIPTYDYGAGAEPVISATRGWPKAGTFHEGRLFLAGLKSRPSSYLASKTNDFFNLDLGTGLDDEGLFRTLDTDQLNAIRHIKSSTHLQIFTTGQEFYCPNSPITPGNVAFVPQENYGISKVRPEIMEGATYYVQYTENVVREFVYVFAEKEGYVARPASLLSSHLINAPTDMAALAGTNDDGGSMLHVVNSDGTIAVFSRMRTEEVAAWYQWITDGDFKQIAAVEKQLYLTVERVFNGSAVQFIELYDRDTFMDGAVKGTEATPTTTITGLDHLDGIVCRARGDGFILQDVTPAAGSVTLSRAVTDWEIGLDMNPTLETLPLNMDFQNGPVLTEVKNIVKALLSLKDTLGVYVNGVRLPDRQLETVLDRPAVPFTGIKETYNTGGWTREATVVITQRDPYPFHLLALSLTVEA